MTRPYSDLVKDDSFRASLSQAAAEYPQILSALSAVEAHITTNADLSAASVELVAMRAQFEAGARVALARAKTLFTPVSDSEKKEPVDLVPWGKLEAEE